VEQIVDVDGEFEIHIVSGTGSPTLLSNALN
jgi:hypothetical protein